MSFTVEELEEFKIEALELLDLGEKSLLALDRGADYRVSFDSIFRAFHNLKGASGMMELAHLQAHTHELESIFMGFKDQVAIPKAYVDMFLRGIDAARLILDGKQIIFNSIVEAEVSNSVPVVNEPGIESVTELGIEEVVATTVVEPIHPQNDIETKPTLVSASLDLQTQEFFTEVEEGAGRFQALLRELEAGQHDRIDATYREIHSLKGAAQLFGYNEIGEVAHAMESALDSIRDGTRQIEAALITSLYKAIDWIELATNFNKKKMPLEQVNALVPSLVRMLNQPSAEVSASSSREQAPTPMPTPAPLAQTAALAPEPEVAAVPNNVIAMPTSPPPATSGSEGETQSIRVPVVLLDSLMNLMGEMVLVRNQVLQFASRSEDLEFTNLSQRLNVVTSEVQAEMMKTRMQPIGNVLSKFHRVVRDLSIELKKSITLTLTGSETELDKSLLEAIKDPLTHIVRNSCDHGIEMPQARVSSGKSETGSIRVNAYHEGGQVVIEISDDGKGLSRAALIKKAIERHLITESQSRQLSDGEVHKLIFAPGFSTAEKITNVSGRGVGMDVVRTNIEKIGGTVEITSGEGHGTRIQLKIPLTLAIVPALLIRGGGSDFAIPQVKLVELVCVDPNSENKIETLQGSPVLRLRGNILPLVDLNQILVPGREVRGASGSVTNIVVLNSGSRNFGLIVDEIQDSADIVVKPISAVFKSVRIYSGSTILGDGSIALILDIHGLAEVAMLAGQKESVTSQDKDKVVLTSELQDFLLIKLNSPTTHAFILNYVHRLEEFKRSDIEKSGLQDVVRYRGAILPVISASHYLGYGRSVHQSDVMKLVVIERGGQLFGLEVEDVVDTLSTTAETNMALATHPCMVGSLTTDERVIVVIDPFAIISAAFPSFNSTLAEKQLKSREPLASIPSRILLVEDSVFFKKVVRGVLENAGHTVAVASDGQIALDILNKTETPFDIIVSDIEMPNMNGIQFAAQVRAHRTHSRTRLVALSSRSDRKIMNDAKTAGFDLYLEKLKPEVLLQAIAELTGARNFKAAG